MPGFEVDLPSLEELISAGWSFNESFDVIIEGG